MLYRTEEPIVELRIPAFADRMSLVRVTLSSAARYCGFEGMSRASKPMPR